MMALLFVSVTTQQQLQEDQGHAGRVAMEGENMGLGQTFKALGDDTRRRIIRLLKEGEMTAGEIADEFTISKPSISHHLAILKQAGLIDDERRGQTIAYSLNTSVMEEVMRWAMEFSSTKGADEHEKKSD